MITKLKTTALTLAALALLAPAGVFAHETPVTASGTLLDVMCSEGATEKSAAEHTRECGLMKHCVASGYGIVLEGKFHKFDAGGNTLAEQIFRSSKKTAGIRAKVVGTILHDGTLEVTSLTAE